MNIKQARKARNWTQDQLAQTIGTTQQTINRWESGQTEPKVSDLRKISNALGITLSFLLGLDEIGESESLSTDEKKLIEYFRQLPPSGKHAVLTGLKDYANSQS